MYWYILLQTGDIHYIYVKPNKTEENLETSNHNLNNGSQDTEPTNGTSSPENEFGNTGISKKQLEDAPHFSEAIKQVFTCFNYWIEKEIDFE